jgi:hypothetical protein
MPSERQEIEHFKRDFPEEYARQEKLAQEIFKDIPEREMPNPFRKLSRRNTASPTDGAGR